MKGSSVPIDIYTYDCLQDQAFKEERKKTINTDFKVTGDLSNRFLMIPAISHLFTSSVSLLLNVSFHWCIFTIHDLLVCLLFSTHTILSACIVICSATLSLVNHTVFSIQFHLQSLYCTEWWHARVAWTILHGQHSTALLYSTYQSSSPHSCSLHHSELHHVGNSAIVNRPRRWSKTIVPIGDALDLIAAAVAANNSNSNCSNGDAISSRSIHRSMSIT